MRIITRFRETFGFYRVDNDLDAIERNLRICIFNVTIAIINMSIYTVMRIVK